MKIKKIELKNIGAIKNASINLEKPLNIFAGKVRQGKTTIINSVAWAIGGSYPDSILTNGTSEGFIHLFLDDDSSIRREFYVSKTGATKDRPIVYLKDGLLVHSPVKKIKELFNPFQLDQNHFTTMNTVQKRRFLVDLFNVDTTKEYRRLEDIKEEGSSLRKKLNNISYDKVDKVNIEDLNKELKAVEDFNKEQARKKSELESINRQINKDAEEILELSTKLKKLEESKRQSLLLIKRLPNPKKQKNNAEIIVKLTEATLTNYKADDYEKKKKIEQSAKESISKLTKEYKEIERVVSDKLSLINTTHGIKGLVFTKNGDFTFEGTSSDMLSTSQLMRFSSLLSSMYPNKLKIELIDRGESLGESIFSLVEKALKDGSTILTTVVGEVKAKDKKNIGVFVVKDNTVV